MVEKRVPSDVDFGAGHRKRLRERMMADPASLLDHEIMELLLGYVYVRRDNNIPAKRLLRHFGGIREILMTDSVARHAIEGCGAPIDAILALIREIIARSSADGVQKKQPVTLEDIVEMGRRRLDLCVYEEVWAALLDKQNRLINFIRIRRGSVDQVPLGTREVVEMMFRYNASSIVLMHNHPGGSFRPSVADRDMTDRIDTALKNLGMYLQDHVIITSDQCFSLKLDRSIPLP